MNLKEAIEPYQYPSGIVGLYKNAQQYEDNCHLFTAAYLHLSAKVAPSPEDYDDETDGKYNEFCIQSEMMPGLFQRTPENHWRIISHDEMIGICLNDRAFAKRIVDYGKSNHWCYDNRVPNEFTVRGWQPRFLSAIPFYKARARVKLSLYDKLIWSIDAITTTFKASGHTSGRQLLYLTLKEMEQQGSWLVNFSAKLFKRDLRMRYGDLQGFHKIYYGEEHPLTVYAQGVDF